MGPLSLRGKSAIVTGGARDLGREISLHLSRLGASVLVVGLPGDPVPETASLIRRNGGEAVEFIGDVGVESIAEECVKKATVRFGHVDALINTIRNETDPPIHLEDLRVADFDRAIYANIRATFLMSRFAIPVLARSSCGVILSAGCESDFGRPSSSPVWSATLAWTGAFMKGIAFENASHGVRANTVCIEAGVPHDQAAREFGFLMSEAARDLNGVLRRVRREDFRKGPAPHRPSVDASL